MYCPSKIQNKSAHHHRVIIKKKERTILITSKREEISKTNMYNISFLTILTLINKLKWLLKKIDRSTINNSFLMNSWHNRASSLPLSAIDTWTSILESQAALLVVLCERISEKNASFPPVVGHEVVPTARASFCYDETRQVRWFFGGECTSCF